MAATNDGMENEAAGFVQPGGFAIMKTYRVEYLCREEWVPGNLVQMAPRRLKRYLEFLAGNRPLVSFVKVNGHLTFKKSVERKKHKCLPTRVRAVEPDWSQEDGYYFFNGLSIKFVSLADMDGFRAPRRA